MGRDKTGLVREALMRHGIDPSLSRNITLGEIEGDDAPRGLITIGYSNNGQWRETAMVSTPTVKDALDLVTDRERLAPLLALGVRAIPAALRPMVPDWVARHPAAQRTTRDLARARTLADDAASGRNTSRIDDDGDGGGPF